MFIEFPINSLGWWGNRIMNTQYDQFLDTLQILFNYDNSEKLFNSLNVIAQLMVEMKNNTLKNASYTVEYKHDRMSIKIHIFKDKPY